MQAIVVAFSRSRKLLPYHLLHGFQSLPWSILIQSENLVLKYYSSNNEIYVCLDKSVFYDFFLKQDHIKDYLKNTTKRLVLNYEKNEVYQRSIQESLKLHEFMTEIDQLSSLKISLPVDLDSTILAFEVLKEVQSFVGIEFDDKTCRPGTLNFDFVFLKYILGFSAEDCQRLKTTSDHGFLNLKIVDIDTWRTIDEFVKTLTPAWPNLKYFYLKSKLAFHLVRFQPVTDINLCLGYVPYHDFGFDTFMNYENDKIMKNLSLNLSTNDIDIFDQTNLSEVYLSEMAANGVPDKVVVPFNSKFGDDNWSNGERIATLPENFFLYITGSLTDELLFEASVFKTHYKLAFAFAVDHSNITMKFRSYIDQLHVRNFGSNSLKLTLDLFPRVKELFLYIFDLGCFRTLESNNFEHLQSLTVYIDQNYLMEFIQSLYSVFDSMKLEKSIAPITFSDEALMQLNEALLFESGWKLLKPTTDAELYQQVGAIIQDTIVRQ